MPDLFYLIVFDQGDDCPTFNLFDGSEIIYQPQSSIEKLYDLARRENIPKDNIITNIEPNQLQEIRDATGLGDRIKSATKYI